MVKSTQIARLDGKLHVSRPPTDTDTPTGIPLAASVDDDQAEAELAEIKQQAKLIFRRLNQNSEPRASIESGPYTIQCVSPGWRRRCATLRIGDAAT